MATHHGKEGVIKAGTDVIGEVTGFSLDTTADTVEDTSLSDTAKTYIAGRTGFSGSVDMNYDETDTGQTALLAGTSISFVLLPEGNTTGDESFTGSGIVTSMAVTVAFQGSGALTIGTVS